VSTKKRLVDGLIPLEETLKAMKEISKGSPEYAIRLWEGLPDQLQKIAKTELGVEGAVLVLQSALIQGFQRIAGRLDMEKIIQIIQEMIELDLDLSDENTGVDVRALFSALEALGSLFGKT
jgi:hypothetical protein